MNIKPNRSPRALIALLPTLMLVSPAFAQEAPTQVPPPPAPLVQSAPAPSAAPVFAPPAPVVQAVPDYTKATPPPVVATVADAPPAVATPARRATATRTALAVTTPRAVTIAPRDSAPVVAAPAAAIAPATATPMTQTVPPVAPVSEAAPVATTTQQTTTQATFALLPWIVGAGIVLLGLIGLLVSRRHPREEAFVYDVPAYQEPAAARPDPIVAPVIAPPAVARDVPLLRPDQRLDPVAAPAPVAAEEAHIVAADGADVAALTDGDAPIANRPWLEFSMRPVRAGTTSDEALVEIELTVGNAGSVTADDVRISTFLFAAAPANAADVEKLLLEHGDASANPVSIAAGEGTRVDATLALPKRDLAALFSPVIVADARYRLADGSEGRTYASFTIGMMQEDGALGALKNNRPSMHEDIEARLYGAPQHA
ncbi:hypothetical protein [Sphingomonas sp.]|uniref:hypothetical protein n=1 Tax=Sphingomonas sp. TaxID=28214 RepID=UPI00333F2E9C